MQVKGKVFTANTVKLGAFTLSSYLIEKMNHYQWLPMQKGNFSQLQTNIQTEFNKPIHLGIIILGNMRVILKLGIYG